MPGIKDWLKKASSDLKFATKALDEHETLDPAVYLTHQCAEKSLKSFFILTGKSIPKTHDLEILHDDCTMFDREFLLLQGECKSLNPYGFDSRYPKDDFHVDQKDLIEALNMANKILNFVKNKVL